MSIGDVGMWIDVAILTRYLSFSVLILKYALAGEIMLPWSLQEFSKSVPLKEVFLKTDLKFLVYV